MKVEKIKVPSSGGGPNHASDFDMGEA
jgi:hypothetical protein